MFFFLSSNNEPLKYIEAGRLKNHDYFIHSRRNLDFFVLLVGCEGTLYIAQDDDRYELGPDQYLLLFPGHVHYGYLPSEPNLSYYWCHFQTNSCYHILDDSEINQKVFMMMQNDSSAAKRDVYLLPEYGTVVSNDRTSLLFRQLIDISKQNCYSENLPNFTLSLLAMEITQEFVNQNKRQLDKSQPHYNIIEILEWIRLNYDMDISVQRVADEFNYNPNYLSTIFKKFTGLPLLKYINTVRVQAAKHLLLDSSDAIKVISAKVGFKDEKHFMKLFKQIENTTPTKYRNIYYRKNINNK